MAKTPSTMLPLGTKAPPFALKDAVSGDTFALDDFSGCHGLLVMFICNHCPYVIHLRDHLANLTAEYRAKGIGVVAINSNDVEKYPDDSPEMMREEVKKVGYKFPYLFDADQSVAKAYQAACTPDFFLFDENRRLVYRGQYDDSRPGNDKAVTGKDLRQALEAVVSGDPVGTEQVASIGCNIKWKPGNEPAYFTRTCLKNS